MGLPDSRLGRILGLGSCRNRLAVTMDLFGHAAASKNTAGQDIGPHVGWCGNGLWRTRTIRDYGN